MKCITSTSENLKPVEVGCKRRNPKSETRNRQRKLISSGETQKQKRETRNPKPTAKVGFKRRNSKPETRKPKPAAKVGCKRRNPNPETRNPKPVTSDENPKPETRNRNPKPETRNPKPETRKPKPETDLNPTFAEALRIGTRMHHLCSCQPIPCHAKLLSQHSPDFLALTMPPGWT